MTHVQVFDVDARGHVARCTCGWCTEPQRSKRDAIARSSAHRILRAYLDAFDLSPAGDK